MGTADVADVDVVWVVMVVTKTTVPLQWRQGCWLWSWRQKHCSGLGGNCGDGGCGCSSDGDFGNEGNIGGDGSDGGGDGSGEGSAGGVVVITLTV